MKTRIISTTPAIRAASPVMPIAKLSQNVDDTSAIGKEPDRKGYALKKSLWGPSPLVGIPISATTGAKTNNNKLPTTIAALPTTISFWRFNFLLIVMIRLPDKVFAD